MLLNFNKPHSCLQTGSGGIGSLKGVTIWVLFLLSGVVPSPVLGGEPDCLTQYARCTRLIRGACPAGQPEACSIQDCVERRATCEAAKAAVPDTLRRIDLASPKDARIKWECDPSHTERPLKDSGGCMLLGRPAWESLGCGADPQADCQGVATKDARGLTAGTIWLCKADLPKCSALGFGLTAKEGPNFSILNFSVQPCAPGMSAKVITWPPGVSGPARVCVGKRPSVPDAASGGGGAAPQGQPAGAR